MNIFRNILFDKPDNYAKLFLPETVNLPAWDNILKDFVANTY